MVSDVNTMVQFLRGRNGIFTVDPEVTVNIAARQMHQYDIGSLVIVGADGMMAGIISERDIVSRVVAKGLDVASVRVCEVMTRRVQTVTPDTSVDEAVKSMARSSIRHLPVVENGRPVGMISSRDVLARQLALANAQLRKGRRVLQDLEDAHPGITRLKTDDSGRVVI